MCTRKDNTDMPRHPHGKISRLTGVVAITFCALILAPIAAPNPALAQQPGSELETENDRDKVGKTPDRAPGNLITPPPSSVTPTGFTLYRYPASGFVMAVPSGWQKVRLSGYVKANFRGGARSCNINVIQRAFPGANGKPKFLATYLSKITRSVVTSRMPAQLQPRVVSLDNATLGGQMARRIVTDIVIRGRNIRLVQYMTFRTNGIYTLTCGTAAGAFDQPDTQRIFAAVHRSVRFLNR